MATSSNSTESTSARERNRESGSAVNDSVSGGLPPKASLGSITVYAISYYLSYGAVYTALKAKRAVRANNAMGFGVRNGARSAAKAIGEYEERRLAKTVARQKVRAAEREARAATKARRRSTKALIQAMLDQPVVVL
jgi:hypothetical protein